MTAINPQVANIPSVTVTRKFHKFSSKGIDNENDLVYHAPERQRPSGQLITRQQLREQYSETKKIKHITDKELEDFHVALIKACTAEYTE